MLIPSIDLQNGHVVQLVQGERLAIEAPSPEPWIERFSRFPRVQLIDLDAARGRGDNGAIVADICRRLPCRVGGGIRTVERAAHVLDGGAHAVIASSALFRDGQVDVEFAAALAGMTGIALKLGINELVRADLSRVLELEPEAPDIPAIERRLAELAGSARIIN